MKKSRILLFILLAFFALRTWPGSAQPAGPPAIGGVETTLVGAVGKAGKTNGKGAVARFGGPTVICLAANGTLYVAEGMNNTIRKITPAGVVTTLAGRFGEYGSTVGLATNGPGAAARFQGGGSLAVNAQGTVYLTDTGDHTVRVLN